MNVDRIPPGAGIATFLALSLLAAATLVPAAFPLRSTSGSWVSGSARGTAFAAAPGQAARGEYITHHLAMCVQCHTPRHEDGRLDLSRRFQGAPMPVESPYPDRSFAAETPSLAGLPAGYDRQQFVHFLRTGETPTGHSPQPPMPPFRMTAADAHAVADYLESLQRD